MSDQRPTIDVTTSLTQLTVRAEGRTEVSTITAEGQVTLQAVANQVAVPISAESSASINLLPAESVKLDLTPGPAVDLMLNLGASAVYTAGPPSASSWGLIGGALADQADLHGVLTTLSSDLTSGLAYLQDQVDDALTETDVTVTATPGKVPRFYALTGGLRMGTGLFMEHYSGTGNKLNIETGVNQPATLRYVDPSNAKGVTLQFPNPQDLPDSPYPPGVAHLPTLPGGAAETLATLSNIPAVATTEEALAGEDTVKYMTPALTADVLTYYGGGGGGGGASYADPGVAYIRSSGDDLVGNGTPGNPYLSPQTAYDAGFRHLDIGVGVSGNITTAGDETLHLRGRPGASTFGSFYTQGFALTLYASDIYIGVIDSQNINPGGAAGQITVIGTGTVIDAISANGTPAFTGSGMPGGNGAYVSLRGGIRMNSGPSLQGGTGDEGFDPGSAGTLDVSQGVVCPAPYPDQVTVKGATVQGTFYANTYGPEGAAVWGSITGTLGSQSDLLSALDEKASATALSLHIADSTNPHAVTKAQVGLGNCDDTADLNKPVSTATQTALDGKLSLTGGSMSGSIVFDSAQTFAGRDLGADGTKLDGIESGADVTDATNVAAAGAVMESDTSVAGFSFVIDEDDMASNSATKVPTQQSVKAYVDIQSGATPQWGNIIGTLADQTDLQAALDAKAPGTRSISAAGLATGGGDLSANRTITVTAASQAEAEAGTDNTKAMTPLRTAQAIAELAGNVIAPASNTHGRVPLWIGTDSKTLEDGLDVSLGSYGYADSGKLPKFGTSGQLRCTTSFEMREAFLSTKKATLYSSQLTFTDVGSTGHEVTLTAPSTPSAAHIWTLPDDSGTLSLTSQVPLLGTQQIFLRFSGTTNSNQAATYTRTLTTVTVTLNNHGYIVGHVVQADFTTGTAVDGTYTITSVSTNTFTFTTAASGTTSGNVNLLRNVIVTSSGIHSVTDSGTGVYYVNFAAAFADANYAFTASAGSNASNRIALFGITPTAAAVRIGTVTTAMAAADSEFVCLIGIR